jgi:dipeptidyl aminopeptidase/acylaminoacyl peptidase
MPGEPAVRKAELFVFNRETKKLTRIAPKWKDETYTNVHWGKGPNELRFIRHDRLRRHVEFCTANVATGETKCLLIDGFENANVVFQPPRYLEESDEMIWWSERSGWAHFYLYDRAGKLKNPITSGAFRASRIVAVDAAKRLVYFNGNAREKGENVYYNHLYCVHLDGSGLTLLDPGDGDHRATMSPSREFVVDNCSRVDRAPTSVLRGADGHKVMDLERADLSRLYEAGWKMPETFTVKAGDGVTDLYGNLWKPFDFDPKKKYPIIAHVYPGPQQEGVTHTFSAVSVNQQLAQLGFIVIQVGHRGGSPLRSKAYASYGYFNLRDYGLADKKTAIEQLAARHSFIDLGRVGIYGHSGGGFMSAAAVLQKPYNEFFKAAVASAGNHDNNIYNDAWAERYHGLREVVVKKEGEKVKDKDGKTPETLPETKFEIKVPTNAELAANLKGHLLLVHGEIDNNVHPANTLRLADALIKANKRFDMLILPGKRHAFGDYQPYFTQRTWDFFAEHLLDHRQTNADIYEKQEMKR